MIMWVPTVTESVSFHMNLFYCWSDCYEMFAISLTVVKLLAAKKVNRIPNTIISKEK